MALWLKQSTSVTIQFGPFLDKTDGVTLETGLATAMDNATTGIRLSKNGGTLADRNSSTAPSYDAMGLYKIVLDATDTNTLGTLRIIFEEAATCLPVWQDFMVVQATMWNSFFGTGGAIPNAVAGASTGLHINGSNSGTTTLAALTVTGTTTMSNGLVINRSTSNTSAIVATGNGTGHGISAVSGSGATGNGINGSAASTNGHGINGAGVGTGAGVRGVGGATGQGVLGVGGATSGAGIRGTGTAGNAQGIYGVGQGSASGISGLGGATGHGILGTGGTNGDGIKGALGGTGVDIRGNITGDITGTLATLTTYTGNTLQTGDAYAALATTTYAEPGQGTPAATASLKDKIGYLYKAWRNKSDQTATTYQLYNDDASTVDHKATVSDDATTATKGEIATGP